MLHTRVPVGRLVDWVDQALLDVHLEPAEEQRRRRTLLALLRRRRQDAAGTTGGSAARGAEDATGANDPSGTDGADGVDGAGVAAPAVRAGKSTRDRLREHGIRTATDLLKAFPRDEVDPLDPDQPKPEWARVPGVPPERLRALVRVLDEDTRLAPIWNWQLRGTVAVCEMRRPRSQRPCATPVVSRTRTRGGSR